jgi:hypothetical protein
MGQRLWTIFRFKERDIVRKNVREKQTLFLLKKLMNINMNKNIDYHLRPSTSEMTDPSPAFKCCNASAKAAVYSMLLIMLTTGCSVLLIDIEYGTIATKWQIAIVVVVVSFVAAPVCSSSFIIIVVVVVVVVIISMLLTRVTLVARRLISMTSTRFSSTPLAQ